MSRRCSTDESIVAPLAVRAAAGRRSGGGSFPRREDPGAFESLSAGNIGEWEKKAQAGDPLPRTSWDQRTSTAASSARIMPPLCNGFARPRSKALPMPSSTSAASTDRPTVFIEGAGLCRRIVRKPPSGSARPRRKTTPRRTGLLLDPGRRRKRQRACPKAAGDLRIAHE